MKSKMILFLFLSLLATYSTYSMGWLRNIYYNSYLGLGSKLLKASEEGNVSAARKLLDLDTDLRVKKAIISYRDWWGNTPLHIASALGYNEIVELLVRYGASLNAKNISRDTALHRAAGKGHKNTVELLLKSGADINILNNSGQTPGYWAYYLQGNNHQDIAKMLIEAGLDLNTQSKSSGWTMLMWASYRGDIDMVNLLLEKGADPAIKGKDGNNALDLAKRKGKLKVVYVIEDFLKSRN